MTDTITPGTGRRATAFVAVLPEDAVRMEAAIGDSLSTAGFHPMWVETLTPAGAIRAILLLGTVETLTELLVDTGMDLAYELTLGREVRVQH